MSASPTPGPSLAEYHGQASRLCDLLNIVPGPDAIRSAGSKTQAEFNAVADWCQRKQKAKQIFNSNQR
jgi:hypothetical protein